MCSGFAGYLPWIRSTVRVLANSEVFLRCSGASSMCWLYCIRTAKPTCLYSFLKFLGLKYGSIMHLAILWDGDVITWSRSYVLKVGLHLPASCILYIAEVHIIHQLLSVHAIHF